MLVSVVSVLLRVFFDGQFNFVLQRLDFASERRHLFDLRAIGERGNVKSRRSRVWQKGGALPRLFLAAIAGDIKQGGGYLGVSGSTWSFVDLVCKADKKFRC